ncbi:MAG: hypothetical protein IKM46_09370 [Clostridia bacterium]|nr:hypothetical protein [Clostridia bacterium]
MRRRRLIRSAYRSGAKKKSIKPILIRVAFVLVLAAVTAGVALLLGSYLDSKASVAESLLETDQKNEAVTEKGELFPDGVYSESDIKKKNVCAAHIDVVGVREDAVEESIRALGDVYNAISVNVVSPSGSLIYLSEALMDYVRLDGGLVIRPAEEAEEDAESLGDALEEIKTALSVAGELGMRKSAVYSVSPHVLEDSTAADHERVADGIVIGEMYNMGFDEVILTSLVGEEEEISTELLKKLVSYLASLRKRSAKIDIGVLLPASVYLVPQSGGFIKTLSEYADFLAISVGTDAETADEAYSSAYDNCHSLKGNFSVYNIRGMIETEDVEIAQAVYAALKDLSVSSVQFSTYVAEPSYAPQIPVTTPDDTEDLGKENENAVNKEDYLNNGNETQP